MSSKPSSAATLLTDHSQATKRYLPDMRLRYQTENGQLEEQALPKGYLLAIGSDLHLPYGVGVGSGAGRQLLAGYDDGCWWFGKPDVLPPQSIVVDALERQRQLILANEWPIEVWGQGDDGRFTVKLGQGEQLYLNASSAGGIEIHAAELRRIAHWRPASQLWYGVSWPSGALDRRSERLIIQPALLPASPPGPRSRLSGLASRSAPVARRRASAI